MVQGFSIPCIYILIHFSKNTTHKNLKSQQSVLPKNSLSCNYLNHLETTKNKNKLNKKSKTKK